MAGPTVPKGRIQRKSLQLENQNIPPELNVKAETLINAALHEETDERLAAAIMEVGRHHMRRIADTIFTWNPKLAGLSFYNPTPNGVMYFSHGEDKGARDE